MTEAPPDVRRDLLSSSSFSIRPCCSTTTVCPDQLIKALLALASAERDHSLAGGSVASERRTAGGRVDRWAFFTAG